MIDHVGILGAFQDSISVWAIIDTILARRFPERPLRVHEKWDGLKLPVGLPRDWVRIADSLGVQTITKADFDDNGLTDMIWLAGNDYSLAANVILDDGGNQYRLLQLSFDDVAFPALHYDQGKAEILYYNFPTRDFYINYDAFLGAPLVLRMDTMVYYKGAFVEKNSHPRDYRIAHIQYLTCGCMECGCSNELSIDSTGKAVFFVNRSYTDSSGKEMSGGTYSAEISQRSLQDIYSTLQYIDFPRLKEYYRAATRYGAPGGTIIITYDGGKTKKIMDEGAGTNGLALLNEQLIHLQLTQKWVRMDGPVK